MTPRSRTQAKQLLLREQFLQEEQKKRNENGPSTSKLTSSGANANAAAIQIEKNQQKRSGIDVNEVPAEVFKVSISLTNDLQV